MNSSARTTRVPVVDQKSSSLFLAAALALALVPSNPTPVRSQAAVQLVKVDVQTIAKGYRVSKLTGSTVVNDKNERIGKIDDLIVDNKNVLYGILQVGGFLGLGGRLVAVPFESLKISDDGKRVELPGASKDALLNLTEFKYRT